MTRKFWEPSWWMRLWNWITYPNRLRKAREEHAKEVKKARETWMCCQTHKIRCVNQDGSLAGWAAIAAYENGLGGRKVEILSTPGPHWNVSSHEVYIEMLRWAQYGREIELPMTELI